MSDSEVPFQIVKHKKVKKKHNGRTQLCKAQQEPCHVDDDIVESCSVLEKLQNCR